MVHSTHDFNSASMCQRTAMPECKCENSISQAQPTVFISEHKHTHLDCSICALIQKTIDLIRQILGAVVGIAQININVLIVGMLSIFILIAGIGTPVKLKTRTNN